MKVKFQKKNTKRIDAKKTRMVFDRLRRLSERRRREQLKQAQAPAKPRTVMTVSGKVALNRCGDTRGMAARLNPPSSEHMKKIRAMRKIYNRQMPVLQCSTCAFSTSCPKFKSGYECAYLPFMHSHQISNETDLMEAMKNLCEATLTRVHRQAMMETLTGGMPSIETSEAFNLAFMQLKTLHDKMVEDQANVTITTDDDSIIGRLFGNLNNLVDHTTQSQLKPVSFTPTLTGDESETQLALPPAEEVNEELIRAHSRDEIAHLIPQQAELKIPEITVSDLK